MAQTLRGVANGLFRVVFLRGSPERIQYSARLFVVALLLAIAASAAVQHWYFGDTLLFVVLRVFSELTMFMLGIVLMTRYVPRFRLVRAMLILVLISLVADAVLVVAGLLGVASMTKILPYAVGLVAMYGASNALHWALQRSVWVGALLVCGYVGVVAVLDSTFRALFAIMAA